VTFTGALDRRARLWAAVLRAGDGAVLSHQTAAEVPGITNKRSETIHISIPLHRRLTQVPGVSVHRVSHVAGLRFPQGQLPVTWMEDTVLDLTQTANNFDEVCGWVTAAFSKGKVTDGTVLAFMGRRTRLRWREDLVHLIEDAANGTHSALEYRYDRDVERAHGLPRELDGKGYHPNENRWRETDRDNAASADYGSHSLHYGWRHVRYEPCATARQVGKVLQNNGWPGPPVPCGPGCVIGSQR
jgi:hypothetical protein